MHNIQALFIKPQNLVMHPPLTQLLWPREQATRPRMHEFHRYRLTQTISLTAQPASKLKDFKLGNDSRGFGGVLLLA